MIYQFLVLIIICSLHLIFLIDASRVNNEENVHKNIQYFYSILEATEDDNSTVIHDKYKKLALKFSPCRIIYNESVSG